ncbi:microfibril-associated glycoprotein 4-like, partial [Symsagittifera roscoffensis]|uniref:microfibril-associated glycoprotein 4-like n=1 Tax=Symsagittifera roscoffensis TaxID=84072 RepID=UPI00307B430B
RIDRVENSLDNISHSDANQGVNEDNSVRVTENLTRLADGLTNISIEIQRVDSDLAYHSSNVASDLAKISSRIDRVENSLGKIPLGPEIVLQRRERFDILFDRTFEEYESGFGDFSGEGDLWLGLKRLHILTQHGRWNLRVSMCSFSNNTLFWSEWAGKLNKQSIIKQVLINSYFKIQHIFYNISFGTMVAKSENMRNTTGTNDGLAYHNGRAFSTTDRDQDEFDGGNCAAATGGGGGCDRSWVDTVDRNGP